MVSVIIPVYNAEKTLVSCVQSVLDQTYRDFELILIDDGSQDRSGQICDEQREVCERRNVRCQVIHQENGGVSKARNCGMDHAGDEYFVCVDSDDVVEPCHLEDLVTAAQAHPECGHVICGFRCTSHIHDYVFTDREPLTVVDRRDYMRLYDKVLIQSPCFALYRTEIVRKYNIRMREDISLAEDTLFNLEYLDALGEVSICVINKANYTYHNEDQNTLNRKYRSDFLDINMMVNRTIAYYLKKWDISDEASWKTYYNAVFFRYQCALRNTFHKQNPMSGSEKLAFNNEILKQESFQEALRRTTLPLSPALCRAYQSGSYKTVLAVERTQRFKRAVSGILRG